MFKGLEEAVKLLEFMDELSTNGTDLSINKK